MESAYRDWKCLPVEILIEIFRHSDGTVIASKDTRQVALVCKAWSLPAQSVLYSSVTIKKVPQLKKFYDVVRQTSRLGKKVKTLKLEIDIIRAFDAEIYDLLTKLFSKYLPNLEYLDEDALRTYVPVLDALQNSHLKHLKKLNTPYECSQQALADYTTSVLLLKDRMEEIKIFERFGTLDLTKIICIHSHRLISNLHLFDKLTSLSITKAKEVDILMLERIVDACKSLKKLSLDYDPSNNLLSNVIPIPIKEISTVTPSPKIQALDFRVAVSSDYKILFYIMRKFPNLHQFTFHMYKNNNDCLNHEIFTRLLKYTSKIRYCDVSNVLLDRDVISETLKQYWESTGEPGSQCINIIYTCANNKHIVEITNETKDSSFKVYASPTEIVRFIQKNGIFIKHIGIRYLQPKQRCKPPNDFTTHLFKSCQHLKRLGFEKIIIKRLTPSKSDVKRKLLLDELYLTDCILDVGVLEQLSRFVPEIKQLRIKGDLLHRTNEDSKQFDIFNIIMEQTTIDSIIIEEAVPNQAPYFMIFNNTEETYHYYHGINESEEEAYQKVNDHPHFYVHCKSLPKLEFINWKNTTE